MYLKKSKNINSTGWENGKCSGLEMDVVCEVYNDGNVELFSKPSSTDSLSTSTQTMNTRGDRTTFKIGDRTTIMTQAGDSTRKDLLLYLNNNICL